MPAKPLDLPESVRAKYFETEGMPPAGPAAGDDWLKPGPSEKGRLKLEEVVEKLSKKLKGPAKYRDIPAVPTILDAIGASDIANYASKLGTMESPGIGEAAAVAGILPLGAPARAAARQISKPLVDVGAGMITATEAALKQMTTNKPLPLESFEQILKGGAKAGGKSYSPGAAEREMLDIPRHFLEGTSPSKLTRDQLLEKMAVEGPRIGSVEVPARSDQRLIPGLGPAASVHGVTYSDPNLPIHYTNAQPSHYRDPEFSTPLTAWNFRQMLETPEGQVEVYPEMQSDIVNQLRQGGQIAETLSELRTAPRAGLDRPPLIDYPHLKKLGNTLFRQEIGRMLAGSDPAYAAALAPSGPAAKLWEKAEFTKPEYPPIFHLAFPDAYDAALPRVGEGTGAPGGGWQAGVKERLNMPLDAFIAALRGGGKGLPTDMRGLSELPGFADLLEKADWNALKPLMSARPGASTREILDRQKELKRILENDKLHPLFDTLGTFTDERSSIYPKYEALRPLLNELPSRWVPTTGRGGELSGRMAMYDMLQQQVKQAAERNRMEPLSLDFLAGGAQRIPPGVTPSEWPARIPLTAYGPTEETIDLARALGGVLWQ
jgi:hypothetical protein